MEKQNVIPELRFSEFTEDWVEKKYNNFYSFKTTNSYSRDKLNYEIGDVKNIHYGDIHTKFKSLFNINNEIVPFINEDINISKITEDCYLKEGDLIIADASEDYNDIGKTIEIQNLNNEKVVAGLHTFLARRESDDMAKGFASFLMKTHKVRLEVMKIAQGTKVLGISKFRLEKIPLFVPNPTEQTKIATFLTAVDKRINLLQKKKAELEDYKKGLMQKLFSQTLRFKKDDGFDFEDWEVKRLGEVGEIINGLTYSPKNINEKGVLVLRSSNVKNRALKFNDNVFVLTDSFNPVMKNDILICVRNGSKRLIGKNVIIDKETEGVAFGAFMTVYRSAFNSFLYHWFDTDEYKKEVHKNLGATINSINGSDLKKFKVPFPSKEEQQKIANFLSFIDKSIDNITNQIDDSVVFKKGLLQKMFV